MTMRKLASRICLLEGKKSSVSIGNVREVLSILTDLTSQDVKVLNILITETQRKMKRKKK